MSRLPPREPIAVSQPLPYAGPTATISVIVPAYNAEPFLDAALASIAAQSRPADEVIVVDDASTDRTAEVADRWSAQLPLVVVRLPGNTGLGAARRIGIEHAGGSLLALLDADDYWMPDHLSVMLDAWGRRGGVIAADSISWVAGKRLGRARWTESMAIPPPQQQARRILAGNFGSYCSLFSRRDYEAVGGFRPLPKSEDWDLWIRMVRSGATISPAPTPTLIYRKRADSLSADDGCVSADIAILEGLVDLVDGDERSVVRRALRRARARQEFVVAFDDVAAGSVARARLRWLKAALRDPSLRGDHGGPGNVLRSLACALLPRSALSHRRSRTHDLEHLTR